MAQNDELLMPWASGVFDSLGQPANTSTSTISGYAVQPSTIGRLNDYLSTCFSGSGYTGAGSTNYQIGPCITSAELAVVNAMYLVSYYNNLAQASMGLGGTSIPWTALAEGDSKIARVNAANLGKEYREMSKTAQEQLQYIANAYRNGGASVARSIDYYNPPVSPYGFGNGWGGYGQGA